MFLAAALQGDPGATQIIQVGSGLLMVGNTALLATIVFKAGGIVEKVSYHEKRLDKIEAEPRGCRAEDCPLRVVE